MFLMSSNLYAYRPLATEDASVAETGHYEIEIGHNVIKNAGGFYGVNGSYTLIGGFFQRFELDFGVPVIYSQERETEGADGNIKKVSQGGAGDLELLGKFLINEESRFIPATVFAAEIRFPSGDAEKGHGESKAGYEILYGVTKTYKDLTFHANLGWEFVLGGQDSLLVRTAVDYKFYEKWHIVLEWDRDCSFEEGVRDPSGILGGIIWDVNEHVAFDAGVRAGLHHHDDRFNITVGFTFAF